MIRYSIGEIAGIIGATIVGNHEKIVHHVSSFEDANEDDITFASDSKFLNVLDKTNAGIIIVPNTIAIDHKHKHRQALLLCSDPKRSFFKIVQLFHPSKKRKLGIHSNVITGKNLKAGQNHFIGANAGIGDNVCIGNNAQILPGVFIGDDVVIGDNVVIKPNVTILEKTIIGNSVLIHSGTTIGSDGFGFVQNAEQHEKLIHTGYVHIFDDVEIGANCTIDRGTLGKTIIGNGVKIDNLVHLAHNVKIGDNTLIVAQVGIAGSTTVEDNVIIAGKAGITGHITIGANSIIGPYAGVHSNVGKNEVVSGIPQMPHTRWRKMVSVMSRLPEMRKRLFLFEKRLKKIEKKTL